MRSIDKKGKDFTPYFNERLVKSLRRVKHYVNRYYSEEGDFNENERILVREMSNHFSLVSVLRNLNFYLEDYAPLNEHLFLMYEALGQAFYPREYFDVPFEDYLNKQKSVAPFENYLVENTSQLNLPFNKN